MKATALVAVLALSAAAVAAQNSDPFCKGLIGSVGQVSGSLCDAVEAKCASTAKASFPGVYSQSACFESSKVYACYVGDQKQQGLCLDSIEALAKESSDGQQSVGVKRCCGYANNNQKSNATTIEPTTPKDTTTTPTSTTSDSSSATKTPTTEATKAGDSSKTTSPITLENQESSGLSTGAIIGIALGGVFLVACIAAAVFFFVRKSNKNGKEFNAGGPAAFAISTSGRGGDGGAYYHNKSSPDAKVHNADGINGMYGMQQQQQPYGMQSTDFQQHSPVVVAPHQAAADYANAHTNNNPFTAPSPQFGPQASQPHGATAAAIASLGYASNNRYTDPAANFNPEMQPSSLPANPALANIPEHRYVTMPSNVDNNDSTFHQNPLAVCRDCGEEVFEQGLFCPSCGNRLEDQQQHLAVPPPTRQQSPGLGVMMPPPPIRQSSPGLGLQHQDSGRRQSLPPPRQTSPALPQIAVFDEQQPQPFRHSVPRAMPSTTPAVAHPAAVPMSQAEIDRERKRASMGLVGAVQQPPQRPPASQNYQSYAEHDF